MKIGEMKIGEMKIGDERKETIGEMKIGEETIGETIDDRGEMMIRDERKETMIGEMIEDERKKIGEKMIDDKGEKMIGAVEENIHRVLRKRRGDVMIKWYLRRIDLRLC